MIFHAIVSLLVTFLPIIDAQSITNSYIGCYSLPDATFNQQFRNDTFKVLNNIYIAATCLSNCNSNSAKGEYYSFFGLVQYGGKCYCFNDLFNYHVELDVGVCITSCQTTDPNEFCSGRNTFQVYGTCPLGYMFPPLCTTACPSYCLLGPGGMQLCSHSGECAFGCQSGTCANFYYCAYKHGDIRGQPLTSAGLRPLPVGVFIFDSITIDRSGLLYSIELYGRGSGIGYVGVWRPISSQFVGYGKTTNQFRLIGKVKVSLVYTGFQVLTPDTVIYVEVGDKIGVHFEGDFLSEQEIQEDFTIFFMTDEPVAGATTYSARYAIIQDGGIDPTTGQQQIWQPGSFVLEAYSYDNVFMTVSLSAIIYCQCSLTCDRSQCYPFTLACQAGCVPGWTGGLCDKPCSNITYGRQCSQNCSSNCAYGVCNPISGMCAIGCKQGFQGDYCTQTLSAGCLMGLWGRNCENKCSANCVLVKTATGYTDGLCRASDGACFSGCTPGYKRPFCNDPCDPGYYGQDCQLQCSGNCVNNGSRTCDYRTGRCLSGCVPGYKGDPCTDMCVPGTYGPGCLQTCGKCSGMQPCHRMTGFCISCVQSYLMPSCTQKNCSIANVGYFGPDCQMQCGKCLMNNMCNYVTGACVGAECGVDNYNPPQCLDPCPAGTFGRNCKNACGAGMYGRNCLLTCGNCKNNETCDNVLGNCPSGCQPGYTSDDCKTPCAQGTYGQGCKLRCGACRTGTSCDYRTGACIGCQAGYNPPLCTAKCSAGYQGIDCTQTCGQCKDNAICDPVTAACPNGCRGNLAPPTCLRCVASFYGPTCSRNCGLCAGDGSCDSVTGACASGCQPGYQMSSCTQSCPPGQYGDCLQTCGRCANAAVCATDTGYCTSCDGNFMPPLCKQCLFGFYGFNCQLRCGQCSSGQTCNGTTGNCTSGCLQGYNPPLCQQCIPGFFGFSCKISCGRCLAGTCRYTDGACESGCQASYISPQCIFKQTSQCPIGYYGSCTTQCGSCLGGATCAPDTGECVTGCQTGYLAPLCQSCDTGLWGNLCQSACGQCANNSQCNRVDGTCPQGCALATLIPPLCTVSNSSAILGAVTCSAGKYGSGCSKTCGNCYGTTACNTVSGACSEGCQAGWMPPLCIQSCSVGYYGQDCTQSCGSCLQITDCSQVSGECARGCQTGWSGANCNLKSRSLVQKSGSAQVGTKMWCGALFATIVISNILCSSYIISTYLG